MKVYHSCQRIILIRSSSSACAPVQWLTALLHRGTSDAACALSALRTLKHALKPARCMYKVIVVPAAYDVHTHARTRLAPKSERISVYWGKFTALCIYMHVHVHLGRGLDEHSLSPSFSSFSPLFSSFFFYFLILCQKVGGGGARAPRPPRFRRPWIIKSTQLIDLIIIEMITYKTIND